METQSGGLTGCTGRCSLLRKKCKFHLGRANDLAQEAFE